MSQKRIANCRKWRIYYSKPRRKVPILFYWLYLPNVFIWFFWSDTHQWFQYIGRITFIYFLYIFINYEMKYIEYQIRNRKNWNKNNSSFPPTHYCIYLSSIPLYVSDCYRRLYFRIGVTIHTNQRIVLPSWFFICL